MNQEPRSREMDELIETTAEQIIYTCQPGATTGDPKILVIQLLESFLDHALLQMEKDALAQEWHNEQAQQNEP